MTELRKLWEAIDNRNTVDDSSWTQSFSHLTLACFLLDPEQMMSLSVIAEQLATANQKLESAAEGREAVTA